MGLTKPRAYQIFDLDYKQSVRVITLTNISLTGGAPSLVDGVNLSAGDRILVAGQGTGSQNGLYQVSVLGTGSNGTWIRSVDADQTGEVDAGMIVMVTEGEVYKDTQWKLTTNDPITIGVTDLVFEQNSAFAFGNIYANGTAVLADIVGDTVTFTPANNLIITANATSDTITFEVSQSPDFTGNFVVSGTVGSNLIPTANVTYDLGNTTNRWNDIWLSNSTIYLGNAQISANATSLILTTPEGAQTVFSGSIANISASTITATGNITGGNLITSGILSVTGNANVGNIGATNANLTSITATANISGGNLSTAGQIEATGNITGGNLVTAGLTSTATLNSSGNANVGNLGTIGQIEATGNIAGGNLVTAGLTSTATLNSSGNANVGNLGTAGLIMATGNVSGGNITTAGVITATGNVTGGNLTTAGNVDGGNINATANITGTGAVFSGNITASTFIGNISGNIDAGGANTNIQFNDDDILNGSAAFTFDKTSNAVTATGNISAGNIITGGVIDATGNITGGNITTAGNVSANYFLGNVACASGIFTTKIFNGNSEANIVSAGGNLEISIGGVDDIVIVTSSGLQTTGTLTATGNITGGNIATAGVITATGNVTGGNLVTTGNVVAGNLQVSGIEAVTTLNVSGDTTIVGNLTVSGTTITANVSSLVVTDPILGLGRGANGDPLTSNDGLDRGIEMFYYNTAERIAFMGFDNNEGKMISAANASIANNIVTVNSYGTTVVGTLEAEVASVTGNVTGGNLTTAGIVSATGNITGGNLTTTGQVTATGNITATGNVTGGNLITAGLIDAIGNITGGNVAGTTGAFINISGTLTTAAQTNITSVGTLNSLAVTGNITSGNFIGTLNGSGANVSNINATNISNGTLAQARLANAAVTLGSTALTLGATVTTVVGLSSVTSTTFVGDLTGAATTASTVTTAAQPNITSVGTLTSVTVTGNVSGGNLTTAGLILATGNVTGGNLVTAGVVDATGNISGSTLIASGNIVVQSRQQVKFFETDNSNFISFRAPNTLTGDFVLTLPNGYGNADQVLSTNGAGTLTWVDQGGGGGGGGATQFPNSTVQPVPSATGNFDLSFNFVQTSQEIPFETSATDPFGVNLGEVYSMMDPVGEVLEPVDLGVLT